MTDYEVGQKFKSIEDANYIIEIIIKKSTNGRPWYLATNDKEKYSLFFTQEKLNEQFELIERR